MKKNQFMPLAVVLASSALLVACGSGSDSDDTPATLTGKFLDSAVANIAYRTETHSGFTNANGEFNYKAGETVTFSIGGIDLPSAAASSIVTPLTLADTLSLENVTVSNITRLLQSLDVDGDASNGITISDTAHTYAQDMNAVDVTSITFSSDQNVTNLIANSGSTTTEIVATGTAINHLAATLNSVLTEYLISGNTYSITSDNTSSTSVYFAANGTGNLTFGQDDVQDITWSISGNSITFTESPGNADYWNWVYTPTSISGNQIEVSFSVSGVEDGAPVSGSGTLTLNLVLL